MIFAGYGDLYIEGRASSPVLLSLPAQFKRNVRGESPGHLESTILRVADETLELTSRVKSVFYSLQASQQLLRRFKLIAETNAAALHPRRPKGPRPDRDFALLLGEWRIDPGTRRPNPIEMTDFNVFTINGRIYPGTDPLVAKLGDRVRIRIGNLSAMDHHPIHIHGFVWKIVETDGGPIPESAQWPETSVLVSIGQTRTVEFIADNPGDWAMQCHMSHHAMTQMGHNVPNLIGVEKGNLDKRVRNFLCGYMTMGETGMAGMGDMGMKVPRNSLPMMGGPGKHGYSDMGGMFTIIKVRENLASHDDPGWDENPPGALASLASDAELRRDLPGQVSQE